MEKADPFNTFFADQRTRLNNLNKFPPVYLETDKKLCNLSINENDIYTIISNLDPNKSHGWDNLSVRMINLCCDSVIYPLKFIFEGALRELKFYECWEKANMYLFSKKKVKVW